MKVEEISIVINGKPCNFGEIITIQTALNGFHDDLNRMKKSMGETGKAFQDRIRDIQEKMR